MTTPSSDRKDERRTISIAKKIADLADEMMREGGYNNFSAYIADLIRRDKERSEDRRIALHQAGGKISSATAAAREVLGAAEAAADHSLNDQSQKAKPPESPSPSDVSYRPKKRRGRGGPEEGSSK